MTSIGGFLPLGWEGRGSSPGVLGQWNVRSDNSWLFANARSALAYLLQVERIQRLWLPALICPELVSAAGQDCAVAYYPLAKDLSPDIDDFGDRLKTGDCVIGVDYFGRQPCRTFREYVAGRKDVLWVEDRAQALAPAPEPWANWVLYSPRKLFGVPDGGIMSRTDGPVVTPVLPGCDVFAAVAARNADQGDNARRFALYQENERRIGISMQRMSRFSRELLDATDPEHAIQSRRENYATLASLLGAAALWRGASIDFAPLGFPVRIPECDKVWQRMCRANVYPARHFAELPSDPAMFPFEHELGATTMTLPCDQRYGIEEMQRVAAVFLESLP